MNLGTHNITGITKENDPKVRPLVVANKPVTRPYLKYAAVAIIAVAGFGGMKFYESEIQKHNFAEKQKANSLVENQIHV